MKRKLLVEEHHIITNIKYDKIYTKGQEHPLRISLSNLNIWSHFEFGFGVWERERERERGVDFGWNWEKLTHP